MEKSYISHIKFYTPEKNEFCILNNRCFVCEKIKSQEKSKTFQMVLRFVLFGIFRNTKCFLCTDCSLILQELDFLLQENFNTCSNIYYLVKEDVKCVNSVICSFLEGRKRTNCGELRFTDVFVILLCFYIVGIFWGKEGISFEDKDIMNLYGDSQIADIKKYNWENFLTDFKKLPLKSQQNIQYTQGSIIYNICWYFKTLFGKLYSKIY